MKKATYLLLLVFAGVTYQQCASQEAEDAGSVSNVSFEYTVQSSAVTGAVVKDGIDLSIMSVSLINPTGKLVVQKELKVYRQGNVLESEMIELIQGEYRIKEFTIRDSNKNIHFALVVNRPNSCEPDKNLLKTFYAGGGSAKKISVDLIPFFGSEFSSNN